MKRNVRALVIGLLCVIAISLAAATLVSPQQPPGTGDGVTDGTPRTGSEDQSSRQEQETDSSSPIIRDRPPATPSWACAVNNDQLLDGIPSVLYIAAVVFLVLVILLVRRYNHTHAFAAASFLLLTTLFLILSFLASTCDRPPSSSSSNESILSFILPASGDIQPPGGSLGEPTTPLLSPQILLILLAAIVVLVTIIVFVASDDDTPTEDVTTSDPAQPPAKGHTVNRSDADTDNLIKFNDGDNDVYRAWRELTTHTAVSNPDVNTPAEFAAKARDADIDVESVDTLTTLFREVRYGGQDATEEREQQAMDALRDIEETSTDEGKP